MAIRIKQIGRIANQVIENFLVQGTLPSVQSVIAGVYEVLGGRVAGTPQTQVTPVGMWSVTNPGPMNTVVGQVQSDLEDLYDENIDLVNRLIRDFDYKQTRRERVAQRIVDVAAQLQAASVDNTLTYQESFGSLMGTNIDLTTAAIDFEDYTCELPPASNRTYKADLTSATLSYTTSGTDSSVVGTLANIVSDALNEPFFVRVASATTSASLTINLTLTGPASAVIVSKALLIAHIGSATTVTVSLGNQNLPSQTVGISRRAEWEFTPTSVSSVQIVLSKSAADLVQGGVYYFDFGIKNFSLFYEEYVAAAAYVSAPISFGGAPIGTITLTTDQVVPPNCGISWLLSTTGPSGTFGSIVPGTPLVYNPLTTVDAKRVYPVRSVVASVSATTVVNGTAGPPVDGDLPVTANVRGSRTPLFNLCRIDPSIQFGDAQVWRGRNAWHVKSYHYNVNSGGVIQNPPPTIADFISPRGTNPQIYTRYQPTEFDALEQFGALSPALASALRLPAIEYPFASNNDQVMHLFEATLIVNSQLAPSVLAGLNATTVTLPQIFAISGTSSPRATLYVNGTQVNVTAATTTPVASAGMLTYQAVLPLVAGKNIVQIVTNNYYSLGGAPFNFGTAIFSTLCAYNGQITWYADSGPMTQVQLFELQYQTARNDYSRYAIAVDPSYTGEQGTLPEQVILVRELPTTLYDVTTQGLGDVTAPTSVIIQAQLSGSPVQPSLTPKINTFTVTMGYS
jgi:hypothetical protein